MSISRTTLGLLLFVLACIFFMCVFAWAFAKARRQEKAHRESHIDKSRQKPKGILGKLENSDLVNRVGNIMPITEVEKWFNRSKNPWHLTPTIFQFIRFAGFAVFAVLGLCSILTKVWQIPLFFFALAILFFWYPKYFYVATGNEREIEWNKMYEFIWVIKHNVMLYDPAKAYMNTKIYIEEHAPHNKEIIQGFDDFYQLWDSDEIDPYLLRYYPFSIPREIIQIIFNMNKTGEFPENELNSLRQYIINTQDLAVEKTLSNVNSKATIFSLPFMMITVIIALMVPLVIQIVGMI